MNLRCAETYIETFDDGSSGWLAWLGMGKPAHPDVRDGMIISRSPWGVDLNHAPPGAGYLHLLFILFTYYPPAFRNTVYQKVVDTCTPNRFVEGGFSNDLRNAKVHVRIKGDVDLRGASLLLLAQGNVARDKGGHVDWDQPNYVPQVLAAQPVPITREWSWQTVTLVTDPRQWVQLGFGHGSATPYGKAPPEDMLRHVFDIIFVLFPLDVRPLRPIHGDPHRLRAGEDYDLDRSLLPQGEVMLDEVRIEYP